MKTIPTPVRSAEPVARHAWVVSLCLMIATSILLVTAYRFVQSVREHARMMNGPAPDLPRTDSKYKPAFGFVGLTWTADLKAAVGWAKQNERLIFLEIDGATDTNGALNHNLVFRDPAVQMELRRYVRVILYIAIVPADWYKYAPAQVERQADAQVNNGYEMQQFQTAETPLYLILEPTSDNTFEVLATFGGIIHDVQGFAAFLKKRGRVAK